MKEFKVGDRVSREGTEGIIGEISGCYIYFWNNNEKYDGSWGGMRPDYGYKYSWSFDMDSAQDNLKLIEAKNSNMNLKTIFSNLFKTEPQLSREKAGIVNSAGELTSEGKDVYLNYLLGKDKEFDKEIVAKVLEEMNKSK